MTAYGQGTIQVESLYCENMTDPAGIEIPRPRFSWVLESQERNRMQSAYRILVTDSPENLNEERGDIWDSGKVGSEQSVLVKYQGSRLKPATKYYWKVRVWDQEGNASDWSHTGTWRMGLFTPGDWHGAAWIGYRQLPDSMRLVPGFKSPNDPRVGNRAKERAVVPCFRKEIGINKELNEAILFVSGLGHYECIINGIRVGERFLSPGWTNYDRSVLYNCHEVTDLLKKGANAIGVTAGNGFYYLNQERYVKFVNAYGEPSLIAQLRLSYSDGSVETIVTDQSWKCTPSPVTYSSIYGGEDYDARLEQRGWTMPGFDDSNWKNALAVKAPPGNLMAETDYPVKVMEEITVKEIKPLPDHSFLYDFGQNASGIIELKVTGKRGQQIRLIPAELITKDSLPNQKASGEPYYFTYTLKGEGVETWRPRFTYYGFRYVQAKGAVPGSCNKERGMPQIVELSMLHTRNSSPATGNFECSDDLFNKTNDLIQWAIKSNFQSVLTDCPHREKHGWLEETYLMGASMFYNFDLYQLYRKLIRDMKEAQTGEGLVPDFVPEYRQSSGGFRDSPEWGSASVIIPWMVWQWYGDTTAIQEAWPMMCRYVDYLRGKSDHHILSHGLGDWFDLGPKQPGPSQLTPIPVTATAIYYYDLALLSKMAGILGKHAEQGYYGSWAAEVKKAFNEKFYDPVTGVYSTGSQTAMSMPWCVGLTDEKEMPRVIESLEDSIRANGKSLTAGDIGFHFLVRALTESGKSRLLYEMNARDDVPGYGFQLKKGATSLTESWAALETVSNNHLMLGHLMEWFYSGLAGIRQDENSVAFKEIILKPETVEGITFAKADYQSPYGRIGCEWRKNKDRLTVDLTIPVNTTAKVFLPVAPGSAVTESGMQLPFSGDVRFLKKENDHEIYRLGSGRYCFEIFEKPIIMDAVTENINYFVCRYILKLIRNRFQYGQSVRCK